MAESKRADVRKKPRMRTVPTPEWGEKDTVTHVRALSARGMIAVQAIIKRMDAGELCGIEGSVQICTHGICDEDGSLLYDGTKGLARLLDEDFKPIIPCVDAILDLAGFGNEAQAKKATKAAKKNYKSRRGSSRSS